jgi:hypothetical protein
MHVSAGDPSYELCPGGSEVVVDSANLVAYIQAVVGACLGAGIDAQMAAFREGFNEVGSEALWQPACRTIRRITAYVSGFCL